MYRHGFFALLLTGSCLGGLSAAEVKVLPADLTLTGPLASQQLLVLSEEAGKCTGDLTRKAKLTSSNPAVATVSEAGVVRAAGDGEATIGADVAGKQASARVRVTKTKEAERYSFRNQIIPLLTKAGCNSGACHGALAGKGGMKLSLRGFAPEADHFVFTQQALGRRVDLLEPTRSLVLRKPTMAVAHGGGQRIEVGSADYQTLAGWVASGAPGPRSEDARIERLEVFPSAALLKPNDRLQVVVRAWYSDGQSADVTRWAKYNSTEELVAKVDADGQVSVADAGETAITVWYSNVVGTCRVTSPLPNAIDPKVFASAARRNQIDDLVLKKLQELHIPPSPLCSDEEFLRRVYLDAAGILPTPEEVQKFLADPAPDKRSKWLDTLLERPEYVDYWTYKWSDLLLVSTHRLPQQAVWAFHRTIRQSVADNKPWDRFARDILMASGSNLEHGAVNYFVLHQEVTDLSEATAVTFMGMSVTCCRCHNHPLEKWTQDQYWGMANLFARVALKNGDRPGEITVQSQAVGDALHPRRGVAMPPAPLDGKPLPLDSSVDRRQYFVDWLTAPENPYFARALVNRVWRNFLGRGLVEAEDDLRQTNPPTNGELLDALATDFVAHHYDVKYLVRTIANSAAYQRSSVPLPENTVDDRFYSHYRLRRLPAEVLLDAFAQVTGVPTPFTHVQPAGKDSANPYAGYPLGMRALQLPDTLVVSRFLDSFGRPERDQPCSCERQQDSSVAQALHLNNGQTLNDKLRDKQSRLEQWLKENITDQEAVRRLFRLALSREPKPEELRKIEQMMAEAASQQGRREVLEDLFWAVLTSKEFLFNH